MSYLRARVEKGRLVVNEPTDLPEGTVLNLVVDDEGDDLDDEERKALNQAIAKAWESARTGNVRPVNGILDELGDQG